MSDPENFLTRWSRRKRQASEETTAAKPEAAVSETTGATPSGAKRAEGFDPASLPPIESLGPGSDIRAFLQKNVPADLARAALRRAWAADPAIRDFVGLSENAWDFNAPNTIPGFGPLEVNDEMRRMLAEIVGQKTDATADVPGPSAPPSAESIRPTEQKEISAQTAANAPEDDGAPDAPSRDEAAAAPHAAVDTAEQQENIATQQNGPCESADRPAPRGHGRALPR